MNLTPRTLFILMIGSLGAFSSCSQDAADSDEQNGAAAHGPLFTKTSFDGCWISHEEGKRLCKITIAKGEVVSFQPMNRPATRTTESAATCAIDSQDGLIAISRTERAGNDRWTTMTTLRFDLSDAPGKSCLQALAFGVMSGLRSVERSDPDDHFLFPPQCSQRGLLVRCSSTQN